MSSLPVPHTAADVTSEWLVQAMTAAIPGATKAEVISLENEKVKSGMLSSVFRAAVRVFLENDVSEEHKLFMKIMPPDAEHQGLMATNFIDVTEIETYQVLFKDLAAFEREHGQPTAESVCEMLPKLYLAGYDRNPDSRAYFMILEDLSPEYSMIDFSKGLSVEQVSASLETLAHFHAVTYCYGQKHKVNFKEKYSFLSRFFENFDRDEGLQKFMEMNMDLVLQSMEGSKIEHIIPEVKRIKTGIAKIYKRSFCDRTEPILAHGDLWGNNVMFNSANKCKVVDWQFADQGSIFLDIANMAFISMDPEETERNEDKLTRAYYDKFSAVCVSFGLGDKLPWSLDEFSEKLKTFGFFLTFLWCSTSFELVKYYPPLKDRIFWMLEKCFQRAPHYFE